MPDRSIQNKLGDMFREKKSFANKRIIFYPATAFCCRSLPTFNRREMSAEEYKRTDWF
jgi:hypothetical protein